MKSTDSKKRSRKYAYADKTQFVLSAPVETVAEALTDTPQLYLRGSTYGFSILSDDGTAKIYVSIRSWNITDTLVTVSSTKVSPGFSVSKVVFALLAMAGWIILMIIMESVMTPKLLAVMTVCAMVLFVIYSRRDGIKIKGWHQKPSDAAANLAREKLMNTTIKKLTDKFEAQLINT